MSYQIPVASVQQYSTNVAHLLQQKGSKLRNAVSLQSFAGKAASVVEQFGAVSAQRRTTRHGDTPLISTPHDKRWVFPTDYDWADMIDTVDRLRLLIDPAGPYSMNGAYALGRAMDDEIINGMLAANLTGENGTTSTGLLSAFGSGSQVVGAAVGASGNTGMNVAKLRAAARILRAAEVDFENEQPYVAMTAKQHDDLLNEVQAISLDFQSRPVLENGLITRFMGFNFVVTERIPGGAGFNTVTGSTITGYTLGSLFLCPFWVKSGVTLGMWDDIKTRVSERADKNYSWQVYVSGTFGATRTEERRCGIITCI